MTSQEKYAYRHRYVRSRRSVPCGNDAGVFYHQDYGALWSTGAVDDAAGDDVALSGVEFDGFVFEIDEELAFDGEKELVVVVVFVPVVFTFDDADADDGVVDFAEGLIEPLVVLRVGTLISITSSGPGRMLRRVS